MNISQPATLMGLLDSWGIDSRAGSDTPVKVLRHAGDAGFPVEAYHQGLQTLEQYQSYQNTKKYGDAKLLISFVQTTGSNASFVGVYKVTGLFRRGEAGYVEARGPQDLVSRCLTTYYYRLQRDFRFDCFRDKIEIAWGRYPNRWCQTFPEADKPIIAFSDSNGIRVKVNDSGAHTLDHLLKHFHGPDADELFAEEAAAYSEGAQYYRSHLCRERRQQLVKAAKERFKRREGRLFCEICKFDFAAAYGALGEGYIECHHTIPVHTLSPRAQTKIQDVALLCSNCHRMIHRRKEWLTMEQLRFLITR